MTADKIIYGNHFDWMKHAIMIWSQIDCICKSEIKVVRKQGAQVRKKKP
jgi:hypothetical protein